VPPEGRHQRPKEREESKSQHTGQQQDDGDGAADRGELRRHGTRQVRGRAAGRVERCHLAAVFQPDDRLAPDRAGPLAVVRRLVRRYAPPPSFRPADLPGDRFELAAVVVNLTGQGNCGLEMVLGTSEWTLKPCELNLSTLVDAVVLEKISSGEVPAEVLDWVPLMKIDGEDAIIKRWLEIVNSETDAGRRR